jgi:hypothetical protein
VGLETKQDAKTVDFDILSGNPCDPAQGASRPAHD